MYAATRSLRTAITAYRRPVVCRVGPSLVIGSLNSGSRFQSRVAVASTPAPTEAKKPTLEPLALSQRGVRTQSGVSISPGDFVELENGDFLKVSDTFQHMPDSTYDIGMLRGYRFRRTETDRGFNISKDCPNNLYLNLYMNVLSGKSEVTVSDVLCKRNIAITNSSSHWEQTNKVKASPALNDAEVFYCDWVRVYFIRDEYFRSKKRREIGHDPNELWSFSGSHINRFVYRYLSPMTDLKVEIDGFDLLDRQINAKLTERHDQRMSERDGPLTSGLRALSMNDDRVLKLASASSAKHPASFNDDAKDPVYTFGDCFCGGGGASRGAVMAGLILKWGLDSNAGACASWRSNFPEANCLEMDARDFHQVLGRDVLVDILHISNPCQYYSKAKTVPSEHDQANIEAAMVIGDWLDKANPRIVTIENVDGLLTRKQGTGSGPTVRECFDKLRQQFLSRGYAFSCEIVNMADYGLPQYRKRLIIIAARRGTSLPPMPAKTHSSDPQKSGLLPHVSVKEALTDVPVSDKQSEHLPLPYVLVDGDQPARTVMADESMRHYSGIRNLTLAEHARLQGFPNDHYFRGPEIRRQIGNAQPPSFGKLLYTAIRVHLQEQDRRKTHVDTLGELSDANVGGNLHKSAEGSELRTAARACCPV